MLRCRDMSELVTDYLEHELPVRRRFGVWLHLRLCEACRRYTDQMRETVALLSRQPPAHLPSAEEERLIAAAQPPP